MKITINSISSRISLRVLIFSSIIFIITLIIIYRKVSELYIEEAEDSTEFAFRAGSESINGTLGRIEAFTHGVSLIVKNNINNKHKINEITYNIVENDSTILGCSIVTVPEYHDQGVFSSYFFKDSLSQSIISVSLNSEYYNYLVTDQYLIPKILKKSFWTEPYFDEGGANQTISTYSVPLMDNDSTVYAILSVDISLDWLTDIANSVSKYADSEVSIFSKGGIYLASSEKERISNESIYSTALNNEDYEYVDLIHKVLHDKKTIYISSNQNQHNIITPKDTYTVFGQLDNEWGLLITTPFSDVLKRLFKMQLHLIIIAIFAVIIISIVISGVIRHQIRPIKQFSKAALEIAGGNFSTYLPTVKHKDEVYYLRNSLDQMQKELNQYIIDLKVSTATNERFESELSIAKKIQMALVPYEFNLQNSIDIFGVIEPAREVGGDLFDYSIIDRKLFFFIGDVAGKGIPASIYMSFVISAMNLLIGIKNSLSGIIINLNDYLTKYNTNVFITLFFGCIDLDTYHFEYCNCGHNPIIIKDYSTNKAQFLKAKSNLVIGALGGFNYQTESTYLKKGDQLILYTDGVTEAEKKDFTQFTDSRLLEWANNLPKDITSKETTENLTSTLKNFVENNIQNDDITIMSIRVL